MLNNIKKAAQSISAKYYSAMGLMVVAIDAKADGKVVGAINSGTSWVKALGMLVLALIAVGGVWMMFTGILALINSQNAQITKGQAFGKAMGGLAMVLIPGIIAAMSGDLSIGTSNSELQNVFNP